MQICGSDGLQVTGGRSGVHLAGQAAGHAGEADARGGQVGALRDAVVARHAVCRRRHETAHLQGSGVRV